MSTLAENNRVAWLEGPPAECSPLARKLAYPWRLVLPGAPGVGKGTPADLPHQRLGASPATPQHVGSQA